MKLYFSLGRVIEEVNIADVDDHAIFYGAEALQNDFA